MSDSEVEVSSDEYGSELEEEDEESESELNEAHTKDQSKYPDAPLYIRVSQTPEAEHSDSEIEEVEVIGSNWIEDAPMTKQLKRQILKAIQSGPEGGSVYAQQTEHRPVNPGININGHGYLGLPLADNVAQDIMQRHQSQRQDALHETVLYENEFTFGNPDWEIYVNETRFRLIAELGSGKATAHKNPRLVISGPGSAHPTKTSDSANNNCFATMLITLPTCNTSITFPTAQGHRETPVLAQNNSMFSSTHMIWLNDATESFLPRSTGYLVAIVYDVVTVDEAWTATSSDLTNSIKLLRESLDQWSQMDNTAVPRHLAFSFGRYFGSEDLNQFRLNTPATRQLALIRQACNDESYSLFLANIERTISGITITYDDKVVSRGEDWEMGEMSEDVLRVKELLDLKGNAFQHPGPFQLNSFIRSDTYSIARQADEEVADYGDDGLAGFDEEGLPVSHIYRDSVSQVPCYP